MPIGESHTAFGDFDQYVMSVQRRFHSPVDMILALLMPAVNAARSAHHRQTQTLDLLKIVEALRYYASVHGKLPESLADITELAVPKVCPITSDPYEYRVEGRTAMIDYSIFGGVGGRARIEIVLE